MRIRLILALITVSVAFAAETKMTVEQLRSFIVSSVKMKYQDKQVAEFLKNVKLTNRLDDNTIEELIGLGAGTKTVDALKSLGEASKSLQPPPPPPAKAVIRLPDPPDSKEQSEILKQMTEYALDYSKRLPNFICTQVTRRFGDPSGMEFWHLYDTVTAKLSYFDQREDYKVVFVNNRSVDTTMEKLGGATSSGEFGSMLHEIFDPKSHTRFEWERWATLRGKRMHVFSYRVAKENSQWRLVYEKSDTTIPGYRGLIYVDKDTLAIMRVTLEAEDIPVSFPIQQARTFLDYDFVDISGAQFVLPLRAEVRMRTGKNLVKNESEFRLYRKFGAEATITYTPDPLSDDKINEQPPK